MADKQASTYRLVVAKVSETLFDGSATSAIFPGSAGILTILPHHEAFVTTLAKGTILITSGSEKKQFEIEGGVLECSGSRVVVLL